MLIAPRLAIVVIPSVLGCGGSTAPKAEAPSAPTTTPIAHENSFETLRARQSEVTEAALVAIESSEHLATLDDTDRRALVRAAARCTPAVGYAAIPAPWSAVIVLDTTGGDEWSMQLVGSVLRMDREHPRKPSLATMQDAEPSVADCTLTEDDDAVVWDILGKHLGPTTEKSYQLAP